MRHEITTGTPSLTTRLYLECSLVEVSDIGIVYLTDFMIRVQFLFRQTTWIFSRFLCIGRKTSYVVDVTQWSACDRLAWWCFSLPFNLYLCNAIYTVWQML